MNRKLLALVVGCVALAFLAVACTGGDSSKTSASDRASSGNKALQSQIYVQKNNIEFNNYNKRQEIADDPTTILWCTAYPQNPNVKPSTYPIVGKLTSSQKRPYSTTRSAIGNNPDSNYYSPELPGPDKMFGGSTEYRYGFTPAGNYVDFTGLETICNTEPTVYQATQTDIVIKTDPDLANAAAQAQAQLKAGLQPGTGGKISDAAGAAAQQTLENATGK